MAQELGQGIYSGLCMEVITAVQKAEELGKSIFTSLDRAKEVMSLCQD